MQRLQWQGRWLYNRSGGLYDFRARFWSPQLGAFLQLDQYQFLSSGGTLWSWPGQNPFRLRDPSGRYGWEDFGNDFYKHSETAIDVSLAVSFAAGTIATGRLLAEFFGLGTLEAGLSTLGAEAAGLGGALFARSAAAVSSGAAIVGKGCSTARGGGAEGAAGGVRVTEKGLEIASKHLTQFGEHGPNQAMLNRLGSAVGTRVTGADANFYLHEVSEATMMGRGMPYEAAHSAAIQKYGVSPFSLYHPEVIQQFPAEFNNAWRAFWGIQ